MADHNPWLSRSHGNLSHVSHVPKSSSERGVAEEDLAPSSVNQNGGGLDNRDYAHKDLKHISSYISTNTWIVPDTNLLLYDVTVYAAMKCCWRRGSWESVAWEVSEWQHGRMAS